MSEPTTSSTPLRHLPGLAPEATPLIGVGLGFSGLVFGLRPRLVALPLLATVATALLLRDPERITPADSAALFAPADGTISAIDEIYEHRFLHTDAVRISISRSLFDVHISRSPAAGQVRYVETVARTARSSRTAQQPERVYIGIATCWGPLLVVLAADNVARRIICRVSEGDVVEAGERVALARFGSRVDLILPRDATHLSVAAGAQVQAGTSRVALPL